MKTPTKTAPRPTEDPFAEADAKVADLDHLVARLTQSVHFNLPEEQRKLQAEMAAAERRRDNAAFVAARDALNDAKRKRNAVIDDLEAAKANAALARQDADRQRTTARRAEMLSRAAAVTTTTAAELIQEQSQLPARLAAATREVDIDLVRQLRRRQAELPELIYAAQMVETGRAIEDNKRRAEDEKAKADALVPALAKAEERVAGAKAERDRIAAERSYHEADARQAARSALDAERQLGALANQAVKREAPVVRSLIGWNPDGGERVMAAKKGGVDTP